MAEEEFREIMCVQETPRAVVLCGRRGPREKRKTEETRPTATKDTGSSVPKPQENEPANNRCELAASSSPQGLQIRAHPGQHVDFSLRRPRAEKTVGYPDL